MLKLTAMLLMLIDHAALVFLPSTSFLYTLCRLIGRLAMPIFAYKIAIGFIHTRDFKKYVKRIGLMTLLAQIPFIWMIFNFSFSELLDPSNIPYFFMSWNVGLTFVCALLILRLFQGLYNTTAEYPALDIIYIVLLGLLSLIADYSFYGIAMVIIFYISIKNKYSHMYTAILLLGITILNYLNPLYSNSFSALLLQLPCVLSIAVIKYIPDTKLPLPPNIWYSFYPVHMLVLAFIHSILY